MWTTPAVAGPRLHAALQEALVRAVDPASAADAATLGRWLRGPQGALGTLRIQLQPRARDVLPGVDPRLPVPDPDDPDPAADLEASDLPLAEVRRGVLARHLLGAFLTDPAETGDQLLRHPIVQVLCNAARHPVAWPTAIAALTGRVAGLGRCSADGLDRLLGAVLELAALSTDATGAPAFRIDLQLHLGPIGMLRRPLDPARPEGEQVPMARCAGCGSLGAALVQADDGLSADPRKVRRVWGAMGDHRRFLVQGAGLSQGQCPVCHSRAVGLLAVPGPAIAGLLADLFPAATGAACPPLPAAVLPVARRFALRRALVDLVGEAVPGPSLLQLIETLPSSHPHITQDWSEDHVEWAILDELGVHSGHALSAERLGLAAVHLAPRAVALLARAFAEALGHAPAPAHTVAVRGAARLLRHAGAIASRGLQRWLRGGRNGLMLPRPFGAGGRSPDTLQATGPLARRCADLIHRSLSSLGPSRVPPLDAFRAALVSSRVGRALPGDEGIVLEPGALRCTRDASALACTHNHRRVDVPAHLARELTGAPCPHPGCDARLAPAPRDWDPLPQLSSTGVHTPRFEARTEGDGTVEFVSTGAGARLLVRVAAGAA